MKHLLLGFFAAALSVLVPTCFAATPAASQNAETYTFDPTHTYVIWYVDHFGFSKVSGKFLADGTLVLDQHNPQNSKVDITIHTADLQTAIPKLDEVLKGTNFFNTAQYSTASFISNKVVPSGNTAKVYGTLTIRGIAKPVTLNVKMIKMGQHPYFMKQAIGFSADATIKRSDFNMSGYIPGVSDATTLYIQAEAELGTAPADTSGSTTTPPSTDTTNTDTTTTTTNTDTTTDNNQAAP